MILKVESTLLKKFNETYNNKDINGQNKLVLKTLKKLIIDFLKNELNLINSGHEIKIIEIEKSFDYNLRISKSLPPIKCEAVNLEALKTLKNLDLKVRII